MIVIAGAILGAIIGGMTAARRKGNKADIAQFVAVYGIAFSLVALILTIFVEKLAF
ncbi:apolipoprotein acyltransferase [Alloyangia pacifica]|uniref:Apolipoprotein acyltransferase n=1 Tax=Alloyangia pacifica TaxID=311180 RepID=A0A2U8HH40_9RHOB|nr:MULTISPECIES: apolipoprotein acyltransferase [Roseobacteraceae]AWI85319.1 apolipoprotein acyltransferase [Alloyangia pacifica]NDV48528.1 apolipoprotein acyltransferase [Salipiger sp. PrR003]NDW35345.1 apolipoprotein acyltransferase [Salipiger sp. PrR007]